MYTNRLTQAKKLMILQLSEEGFTQAWIASEVGCHRNTVGRFLRRNGIDGREG